MGNRGFDEPLKFFEMTRTIQPTNHTTRDPATVRWPTLCVCDSSVDFAQHAFPDHSQAQNDPVSVKVWTEVWHIVTIWNGQFGRPCYALHFISALHRNDRYHSSFFSAGLKRFFFRVFCLIRELDTSLDWPLHSLHFGNNFGGTVTRYCRIDRNCNEFQRSRWRNEKFWHNAVFFYYSTPPSRLIPNAVYWPCYALHACRKFLYPSRHFTQMTDTIPSFFFFFSRAKEVFAL